jgi:hypothetical protein
MASKTAQAGAGHVAFADAEPELFRRGTVTQVVDLQGATAKYNGAVATKFQELPDSSTNGTRRYTATLDTGVILELSSNNLRGTRARAQCPTLAPTDRRPHPLQRV